MSNFYLKDPDCVFIHIPKTGGSTIRRGLWKGNYEGPEFGQIPADWPDVYKFAFVRHPLDRLVSAYSDFFQIRNYRGTMEDFIDIVTDDNILFDERRSNTKERIRHHCIAQTHPFNCLNMADDLYRFEDFAAEIDRLGQHLNVRFDKVPHRRKTKHDGWRDVLDRPDILRLTEFYAEDFDLLGYSRP